MNKPVVIVTAVLAALLVTVGVLYYLNQNKEETTKGEEQNNAEQTTEKDVREVVWNQLPSDRKEQIDGTWKDGKISKVILTKTTMSLVEDKSYEGKEVYMIDFPTKSMGVPNNTIVYADIETLTYIGDGLVD